jgi:preprotein translocase subunit SecE
VPNKVTTFISDVKVELKKVSWPTRHDLIGSTIVVIVAVALLASAIGIWDFILSRLINLLLK